MPSKKNTELLNETKQRLERAEAVFFVNYQGLTHKQLEEARISFKENDSELSIAKNTLTNIAFKERKNIDLEDMLSGPLALLYSFKDPIATAKTLYNFLKKYSAPGENPQQVKFGVFGGKVIDSETVLRLATIPSREVLLGRLAGLLKSPMSSLVYSLNWNIQKLALVLKAIESKKS